MPTADHSPTMEPSIDWDALLPVVVLHLFDEPARWVDGMIWCYGSEGLLVVHVGHGTWYDHKAGNGGDTLDLVKRALQCGEETAMEWLKDQGLIDSPGITTRRDSERWLGRYRAYRYRSMIPIHTMRVFSVGFQASRWSGARGRRLPANPLLELLRELLRSGPKLQIDETTVQVLKEPGRDNTTKSYVWVARGGPPETPVLVYRYEPSRGAWVPADIIGDYQGYVQTDGYEGYERPCSRPGVVHVGCLAHVRRAFKEAADALGKVSNRVGTAHQALAYIAKLYRIESELSEYRESDPERFQAERRARAQPVLDKMYGWLRQKQHRVPPSTAVGKAIAFALGQWPKLIRYLDHPQLTPDNNSCEQAIRPFVIGRKNWLFSGSPRGAAASALLYSLIETAKANGREPYAYLRELFEKLPLARTRADYLALLPTARPPP